MNNREDFLNNIATKLKRERRKEVIKPAWKHQVQWELLKDKNIEDLIEIFARQCAKNNVTLKRVNKKQLQDTLRETILHYGGGPLISGRDSRYDEYQLTSLFKEMDIIDITKYDRDEAISIAEKANIGITFSEVTLAESATVTLFHDRNKSRMISLLPTNYIALIPIETIVPRLSYATRMIHEKIQNKEAISSNITFVSGPSNSADIESTLVHGVHGPVGATYIIIDE